MVTHQRPRPLDTLMKQKLVRGLSCTLAEAANEVGGTDSNFTRQVTQPKIAFEASVDEFDGSPQYRGSQSPGGVLQYGRTSGVVTQKIARQSSGHAI